MQKDFFYKGWRLFNNCIVKMHSVKDFLVSRTGQLCIVQYSVTCQVFRVLYIVLDVHCTEYSVQYTMQSVQYAFFCVPYSLCMLCSCIRFLISFSEKLGI